MWNHFHPEGMDGVHFLEAPSVPEWSTLDNIGHRSPFSGQLVERRYLNTKTQRVRPTKPEQTGKSKRQYERGLWELTKTPVKSTGLLWGQTKSKLLLIIQARQKRKGRLKLSRSLCANLFSICCRSIRIMRKKFCSNRILRSPLYEAIFTEEHSGWAGGKRDSARLEEIPLLQRPLPVGPEFSSLSVVNWGYCFKISPCIFFLK